MLLDVGQGGLPQSGALDLGVSVHESLTLTLLHCVARVECCPDADSGV